MRLLVLGQLKQDSLAQGGDILFQLIPPAQAPFSKYLPSVCLTSVAWGKGILPVVTCFQWLIPRVELLLSGEFWLIPGLSLAASGSGR